MSVQRESKVVGVNWVRIIQKIQINSPVPCSCSICKGSQVHCRQQHCRLDSGRTYCCWHCRHRCCWGLKRVCMWTWKARNEENWGHIKNGNENNFKLPQWVREREREVEFLFILVFIFSWIFRHSVCRASFFGFFPTSEQLIVELSARQRGTEKFYRFSFFPLHFAAFCLQESKGKFFCRFRIGKHLALPLCQNLCETRAHSGKLIFENLSKSVDKFSVCISMDALTLYDCSIAVDISLKILSSHHDDAEKRGKLCWIFSLLISGIASFCRCLCGKQKREKRRRENLRVSGWRSSEMSRRQISV